MDRRADLWTQVQAAKYLGVSLSWIRGRDGPRPERIRLGRKVYYTKNMLDEFIESRREAPWQSEAPKPQESFGSISA